jgi:hypothetical protein
LKNSAFRAAWDGVDGKPFEETPELSKGLEFDLVVLIVDPEAFGTGVEGAVDRYVAMTRATQQLVILTSAATLISSSIAHGAATSKSGDGQDDI